MDGIVVATTPEIATRRVADAGYRLISIDRDPCPESADDLMRSFRVEVSDDNL